jgi:two-component system, chemotaxis family, CheB/CheR fusion protein
MQSRVSVDAVTAQLASASLPAEWVQSDPAIRFAWLAAIVESSDDAIISKNLDGRILSWNAGANRIFGYRAEEVVGKSITIIIPKELHGEEAQILEKIRRGESVDHFDTVRLTKDGRRIPISLTVSPVRDSRGIVVGASKIARDISERKLMEQLLVERDEALRQADRRKDQFLALVAHELRNQLGAIRYAVELGKRSQRAADQQMAERVIEQHAGHMSRLLEDLVDIARITHGTISLNKTKIELRSVVETAIETARRMLDSRNHQLSIDLPIEPVRFEGDALRLTQVYSNLLINAAKYTAPGGRIELRAAREGNEIVVVVRDNGMGISAEMMPRLFTLFSQGRPAPGTDGENGLGVGLALVRGLVSLHGGSVQASSAGEGCGSEFTVRLPAGSRQEASLAREDS